VEVLVTVMAVAVGEEKMLIVAMQKVLAEEGWEEAVEAKVGALVVMEVKLLAVGMVREV
jgi:hypothetical protein